MEHQAKSSEPVVIKNSLLELLELINHIPTDEIEEWVTKCFGEDSVSVDDIIELATNIKLIDLDLIRHINKSCDTDVEHAELSRKLDTDDKKWNNPEYHEQLIDEFIDVLSSPGLKYINYLKNARNVKSNINKIMPVNPYRRDVADIIKSDKFPTELYTIYAVEIVKCLVYFVNNQSPFDNGVRYVTRSLLWKNILEVIKYGFCCPTYEYGGNHDLSDYEGLFREKLGEIIKTTEFAVGNFWREYSPNDIAALYYVALNKSLSGDIHDVNNIYPLAPIIIYADTNNVLGRKSARK